MFYSISDDVESWVKERVLWFLLTEQYLIPIEHQILDIIVCIIIHPGFMMPATNMFV